MYLSRIQLNDAIGQNSQLGLLLKDRSYGIHRLLHDLFSGNERFLFREEIANEQMQTSRSTPLYYTLSKEEPKLDSVIFNVDTKPFTPKIDSGSKLLFRLRANPTISRLIDGKKKSVRHDVIMNAQREFLISECHTRGIQTDLTKGELLKALHRHKDYKGNDGANRLQDAMTAVIDEATKQWLIKRGQNYGFDIEPRQLQATGYRWNALPEKNRKAGFSSVDYEGVLTVTDSSLFLETIAQGLGPAKAFGCGLMLIKRAN